MAWFYEYTYFDKVQEQKEWKNIVKMLLNLKIVLVWKLEAYDVLPRKNG